MKKISILTLFALFFLTFIFYIFTHINRVETDIFSLINFKENQNEQALLKAMQDDLANEFLLLTNQKEAALYSEKMAQNSGLFKEFKAKTDVDLNDYLSELNRLKIALLNDKIYNEIISDSEKFFKDSAQSFFNQFIFKPLSPKDDFFALGTHSNLINQKISLNISDMMLEILDEDESYYLIKARLNSGYNANKLIKFYEDIKAYAKANDGLLFMSSGALYGAFGKAQGDKESVYMSLASLSLVSLFLLLAFRNFAIFKIVFIAIFGFACGFCASLLVFERLHIMVVVISTGLVGLMFDFALHWLGKNQNLKIEAQSIRGMLKIFLLGLIITMSGYGVFIFAPLELLRQTAIFSFFTLLGAFLFTYFCLPIILEGKVFNESAKFSSFLERFCKFCSFLSENLGVKFLAFAFVIASGFLLFNLSKISVSDNIKDYSNSPQNLIDDTVKISSLTGINTANSVIVIKGGDDLIADEKALIRELKKENLLTNHSSLSSIFLSKTEQDSVKTAFKKAKSDENIIKFYKELGFDEDMLLVEFDKAASVKTLSVDEILTSSLAGEFKRFKIDKNSGIIYAHDFIKNEKSEEILAIHNAFIVDFAGALNENLTDAKRSAAVLKILAFFVAFIFLWLFFGLLRSVLIMSLITLGVLCVLCVFVVFGVHINIFAVFGLILASAVGIDYMIFALNRDLSVKERIFGITTAFITSFISFFMLSFSATNAVSVFGLAVSLCILFYGVAASVLSVRNL